MEHSIKISLIFPFYYTFFKLITIVLMNYNLIFFQFKYSIWATQIKAIAEEIIWRSNYGPIENTNPAFLSNLEAVSVSLNDRYDLQV